MTSTRSSIKQAWGKIQGIQAMALELASDSQAMPPTVQAQIAVLTAAVLNMDLSAIKSSMFEAMMETDEGHSQATKKGLDTARAQGTTLGRPRAEVTSADVVALALEGKAPREIAEELGVSRHTVKNRLSDVNLTASDFPPTAKGHIPRRSVVDFNLADELKEQGMTWMDIAARLGVSKSTLYTRRKERAEATGIPMFKHRPMFWRTHRSSKETQASSSPNGVLFEEVDDPRPTSMDYPHYLGRGAFAGSSLDVPGMWVSEWLKMLPVTAYSDLYRKLPFSPTSVSTRLKGFDGMKIWWVRPPGSRRRSVWYTPNLRALIHAFEFYAHHKAAYGVWRYYKPGCLISTASTVNISTASTVNITKGASS
tara:strand:+ start:31906 stop:33006 length:1101 start_codon:yes stop_codon:yes gene_type:complete